MVPKLQWNMRMTEDRCKAARYAWLLRCLVSDVCTYYLLLHFLTFYFCLLSLIIISDDINLHNRHFLKLLDFTPEEITYLLIWLQSLKKQKRMELKNNTLKGKILLLFLKKHQHEHDVHLKWQHMIRVHM